MKGRSDIDMIYIVDIKYVCDYVTARAAIAPEEVRYYANVHFRQPSKNIPSDLALAMQDAASAIWNNKITEMSLIQAKNLDWRMSVCIRCQEKRGKELFIFDGMLTHYWHKGLVVKMHHGNLMSCMIQLKQELEKLCLDRIKKD